MIYSYNAAYTSTPIHAPCKRKPKTKCATNVWSMLRPSYHLGNSYVYRQVTAVHTGLGPPQRKQI